MRLRHFLDRVPGECLGDDVEYLGPFPQYRDEVDTQIPCDVAENDAHDQLAEHRGLAQPARGDAADHGERENTRHAEDDRRDRVTVYDGCGFGTHFMDLTPSRDLKRVFGR